jgi:hypothetical protein
MLWPRPNRLSGTSVDQRVMQKVTKKGEYRENKKKCQIFLDTYLTVAMCNSTVAIDYT